MEKFSIYSDKTTGINPFIPVSLKPTIPTLFFHSIIIIVKLLIFIPTLILFVPILNTFSSGAKIITDVVLAYFFNVSETELIVEGIKKSDETNKLKKSPHCKDVILVNATGPLDWFIWKLVSENSKKVKVGIATSSGIVVMNHWFQWVNWCFNGSYELTPSVNDSNLINIVDIDASSSDIDASKDLQKLVGDNSTLYVIVEGTITNGKGLLSYPKGFDVGAFCKMVKNAGYGLKVMSVKVSPIGVTETVIPTSKLYWLFCNFGSLNMNVKYRLKLSDMSDIGNDMISDTIIREKLANNGRFKLLGRDMDVTKKGEYLEAVRDNYEKKRK